MKKIALLHYAYPPNIGGVEILLRQHAYILAELGYKVTIVTGSGKETNPKIKLIEIKEIQSILRFNPPLYEKIVRQGIIDNQFYHLSDRIKQHLDLVLKDQDVIIIHNMLTLIHNLPFEHAMKNFIKENPEKKIIVWVHDQTYIDREKILEKKGGVNLNPETKKSLLQPIEKAVYVVISDTFKKLLCQIMDLNNNLVLTIPNGINIKNFLEIDNIIWEIIGRRNILDAFPVILSPVNLLPRKRLDYAVKVIAELKKTYPKIMCIITGKQSIHRDTARYKDDLRQLITSLDLEQNVIFISDSIDRSLTNSEIHDLYQLSDLVFYFSDAENFGLPIVESALAKVPIFVSNLNVFHEVGKNYINFIDCNNLEPSTTAQTIHSFIEKNNLIKLNHLSRNCYNLEKILKEKLVPLL